MPLYHRHNGSRGAMSHHMSSSLGWCAVGNVLPLRRDCTSCTGKAFPGPTGMRGRSLGNAASAASRAKKYQRLKTACEVLTVVDLVKDLGLAIAGIVVSVNEAKAAKASSAFASGATQQGEVFTLDQVNGALKSMGLDAASPDAQLSPAQKLQAASKILGTSAVATERLCAAMRANDTAAIDNYVNTAPETTSVETAISGGPSTAMLIGGVSVALLVGALAAKAFSKK